MITMDELNDYIKYYLEEDKTHTAILLTGEWGSGKTYYVEKVLVPFLQKDKKSRCIVISLYGLEDLTEISKSIYLELRIKTLGKNSEAATTGKLIAKTIAKNLVGKIGIDVSMSEDDLQNLYSSADLSGKLLVFEDVERSNIKLSKLLGYINNLVERDGAKVLLVANENEILKKPLESYDSDYSKLFSESSKIDDEKGKKQIIPESVQEYIRVKEKTISDTICFENNYCEAIKNIVFSFNNEKLNEIVSEGEVIKRLVLIVREQCHKNLRTLIFATQKTVDIFKKMGTNFENDFLKCIYFGILHFAAKLKAEEFPEWQGTEYLSTILGTNRYPLFKFCYDYIRWQMIDTAKIEESKNAYYTMKLYDENADQNDIDLQKIYTYYEMTEHEVRDVLATIEKRLENPEDIGFYSYGKLAAYLVLISHVIQFDYTQCKKYMIENIKGKGDYIDSNILFLSVYDFEIKEKEEFNEFIKQLSESMNIGNIENTFSYNPDDIKDLYEQVVQEESKISKEHKFLCKYDVEQIVKMLFHASAKQIQDFRSILFAVYRDGSMTVFLEEDIAAMKKMKLLVQNGIVSSDYYIDKIQEKQLDWLCDNLESFIS